MKETREERRERQSLEKWQLMDVLRRAGNAVEEEVTLTGTRYIVDVVVTAPSSRTFAVEIQGIGLSHLSRAGWLRDILKAQAIAAAGWWYVPVTWQQVHDGDALEALARCGVQVEADNQGQGEKPGGPVLARGPVGAGQSREMPSN